MFTFSEIFPSKPIRILSRTKAGVERDSHATMGSSSPGPRLQSMSRDSNRRSESRTGRSTACTSSSWRLGSKPTTAYDTEEGTLASWDVQYRCQRSLQGRGQLDHELKKIFTFYFPHAVQHHMENEGHSAAERRDANKSGCNLQEYWEFWKKIDFFQGVHCDCPPFFINKSFAVGCGMHALFEDFSRENSKGLQLKMQPHAVMLSFCGWSSALREMGRLIFKDSVADPEAAADRFIYQVILPHCHREEPNPVFTHFKRSEVSALLQRYRPPLLKLYDFFCGASPNVHAHLTPQSRAAPPSHAGLPGEEEDAAPGGRDTLKLRKGMNVEEFLLLCRCTHMCPGLLDELSLRYIFAHANYGWDSDGDVEHLDYPEFLQCLCRVALVAFGSSLLQHAEPGQPGPLRGEGRRGAARGGEGQRGAKFP
jgi:hypothetical protein